MRVALTAIFFAHAVAIAKGQPLTGGKLNSFADPYHLFFEGADTDPINTYQKAKLFCRARGGRLLARQDEWCASRTNKDWTKRSPWNGQQETEQWVPVRLHSNNINNYLLIGPRKDTDHSVICKSYDELFPGTPEPCVTATGHELFCVKPEGCTDNRCTYECPAGIPKGFYPDPLDCQGYCHCSGGEGPSWWETVAAEDLVWDPWCRDSKSIVGNKQDPLSGMSGGCPNKEYYVDNKSYCTPESDTPGRQLRIAQPSPKSPPTSSRELAVEGVGPSWGLEDDKPPFETNFILCTAWPSLPRLSSTCADVWGDPHIVTYDHLTYDVLGDGDYVLSKSMTSGFLLEGRFKKFESMEASTMTGFALKSGRNDDPDLEVFLPNSKHCGLQYMIGGTQQNVHEKYGRNGTISTGTEKIHFMHKAGYKFLLWKDSGISIKYQTKHSKTLGCYLNAQFCIPDDIKAESLVGLFGSPDGDKNNDFMDPDGKDLELVVKGKTGWKDAYDYETKNWCIRDQADSLFTDSMTEHKCDLPYDPTLENEVKNAPPELKAICGGNKECLTEGTVGEVKDSTDSMVKVKDLVKQRPELIEADPENYKEPTQEEEDDIIEHTTAEPAQINDRELGGKATGDPHFTTWSGHKFDFHGGCDLVLVNNSGFDHGRGLNVHIRTKINSWWSSIEAVAIQIGDHDILEVMGGETGGEYWSNRQLGDDLQDVDRLDIMGYEVLYRKISSKQKRYRIELGNGDALSIETYKSFVTVNAKANNPAQFLGTLGLMGSYPSGKKLARDGVSVMENAEEFGKEWQVLETEPMLFHSLEGTVQHPEVCAMPSKGKTTKRRLGESTISTQEAVTACARVNEAERDACIFDVLATNDKDMAGTY